MRRAATASTAAALALLLCAGAGALSGCGDFGAARPNVIVYVVDTLRADALGVYGGPEARTPNIDAFAAEGVVFENAWANASWTRASMASLLTGRLPWSHGAEDRSDRLPEGVATLAQILSERGWTTGLVSANPNVGSVFGFDRSFDTVYELFARSQPGTVREIELVATSAQVNADAIGWMEAVPQPFFLLVLSIDPHSPYTPPRRFDAGRERPGSRVVGTHRFINRKDLSERDKARIRELYRGEVSANDHAFGELLAALDRMGIADDTIVVLTSDHGEELWEYDRRGHGKSLAEPALRIPLVIRHPGSPRVPAGGHITRPAQTVDVLPTLLDLIGIPAPDGVDGRSLLAASSAADAPVLAGLRLDGHDLLSASSGGWKVVWDVKGSEVTLHDLRSAGAEARAVDEAADPAAAAARDRLFSALQESVRDGHARRPEGSQAGELPESVEASLRALGYLD